MLHFIPAWYQQNKWCENEQQWYVRRMYSEFDDTVKQIQLFHRSNAYPYQILLLGFSPNFRHFLHRQGVYHAPYWSCFDAIQEIGRKKTQPFSYHDLDWPRHTEFLYTPFAAIAMLKGEKYAQIEFGEDGNPIQIDIYKEGKLHRRNFYDDRGFISSSMVYLRGEPCFQDYLMENGIWKLRCFQKDGHVEINPKYPNYLVAYRGCREMIGFSRLVYDSMDEVIREVLGTYLKLLDRKDIFCVAMHERHTGVLRSALEETMNGQNVILSFFEDRCPLGKHQETARMLEIAGYVITDTKENAKRVKEETTKKLPVLNIPLYDTRADFGISHQLSVQKILVPVDGMEEERFRRLTEMLGKYLMGNANARVCLFTRQADYGREEYLLRQAGRYLKEAGFPEEWAAEEESTFIAENNLEEQERPPKLFFAHQCVDELSVRKCVREQRIVVDMRNRPEVYLQVMALSAGIPQIVYRRTQFVWHEQNGYILKDMEGLPHMLDYYLGSLINWNAAKLCSYRLGKEHTAEELIKKWKEVIDCIGQD